MLTCQKSLFDLEEGHTYLNCAYMSPQLKRATEIGLKEISRKSRPYEIFVDDFFRPVTQIKSKFAQLINAKEKDRIALIPSVSYGLANVANNVHLKKGDNIVILGEQFPSNYYCWKELADRYEGELVIVDAPDSSNRVEEWNNKILESINEKTKLVALGQVHWADGTLFDLKSIREKTRAFGALLVIDGTQSVGALPFDVQEIQVDALICAAYKWLLGPYSLGMAYYGPYFDTGKPIEENWINRKDSEDFKNLVQYQDEYRSMAGKYSVGEQSNFMLIPMMDAALQQLLEWNPNNIQEYCGQLWSHILPGLEELGCQIEKPGKRGEHLVGIGLDDSFDRKKLGETFKEEKVYVSLRGNSIRVSPHLFNEKEEMNLLLSCFQKSKMLSSSWST